MGLDRRTFGARTLRGDLKRSQPIWRSSGRKNPPGVQTLLVVYNAGTSLKKADDPVKHGGAGEEEGCTNHQHERTRGRERVAF